jgi:hypothetical protein
MIVGHQECIDNKNRESTVKCISNSANLFFINKEEFLERFKLNATSKFLEEEIHNKTKLIDLRKGTLNRAKCSLFQLNAKNSDYKRDPNFRKIKEIIDAMKNSDMIVGPDSDTHRISEVNTPVPKKDPILLLLSPPKLPPSKKFNSTYNLLESNLDSKKAQIPNEVWH